MVHELRCPRSWIKLGGDVKRIGSIRLRDTDLRDNPMTFIHEIQPPARKSAHFSLSSE